jgi:predicted MFS family arabinose efflux permease
MILFTESRLLPQKAKSASPEAPPAESILRQFKNRRFTAMFICDVVGFFSYMITFQYFIDRLINGVNLSNNEAYSCMSLIAIGL